MTCVRTMVFLMFVSGFSANFRAGTGERLIYGDASFNGFDLGCSAAAMLPGEVPARWGDSGLRCLLECETQTDDADGQGLVRRALMTEAEARIADEAIAFAKPNRRIIARRFTDPNVFKSEDDPVSVSMAGSPGAGKTEASIELIFSGSRFSCLTDVRCGAPTPPVSAV